MGVLAVLKAKEVVANAYDELQVPVGAPPEQLVATFRVACLRKALQMDNSSSNLSSNGRGDEDDAFQRQAVAYRFLYSLPLLNQTEYTAQHIFGTLRPLTPVTGEEANERASAMLDVAITSMEQAQRAWGLPYTNYVISVHYWLRKHVVRRRYSEFATLHAVLQTKLPVLPMLPPRAWAYKMRMPNDDGARAQALTQYLMRVVTMLANRGLFSLDVMDFLEIDYRRVRAEEEALAVEYLARSASSNVYYIVCCGWLDAWKKFLYTGDGEDADKDAECAATAHHGPPPGKISNGHLVDISTGAPKDHLMPARHYRCVNSVTWTYLRTIYGVDGPTLARSSPDIYEKPVVDLVTLAVTTQHLVRGFLGRRAAKARKQYVLLQDPDMERRMVRIERQARLDERMAVVRKYVNVKEYQTRHIAAIKIQRAFRMFLLRAEHKLLMAESVVPEVADNFQQIDEYLSLDEIGVVRDPQLRLAHFLITMNKGVPLQKLRSRRKTPKWRLFKINQIGSQLLWSSKKRSHALAFVNVVHLAIEAPVVLKSGFGRRKPVAQSQGVVVTYRDGSSASSEAENNSKPSHGEIHELILMCESACECEALHFGLRALVAETTTRISNGASYVDGHGMIRRKYPHAKRLIRDARALMEQKSTTSGDEAAANKEALQRASIVISGPPTRA
jgi:hypothetical protein|uniref:DUSP domain-containing protein n=1 Tax=Globisporangium ultimum (strain ATCC 200006 / CBS 805.95 / DAOM BR144) TaxID=431595 RepID=K3X0D7_GLOUD